MDHDLSNGEERKKLMKFMWVPQQKKRKIINHIREHILLSS